MVFSLKDMLFSFVAGLVVFSLLMWGICVSIFNSETQVAKVEDCDHIETAEAFSPDETMIFKFGEKFDFAVFTMLDKQSGLLYITEIKSDYLVNYRDSLSYVSTLYSRLGDTALVEIVNAFSGVSVSENNVIYLNNISDYESFSNDTKNIVNDFLGDGIVLAGIKEIPLTVNVEETQNTHEIISVIDLQSSVKNFKNLFGLK